MIDHSRWLWTFVRLDRELIPPGSHVLLLRPKIWDKHYSQYCCLVPPAVFMGKQPSLCLLLRVNAAIVNCIVRSQWLTFFVTENTNSCVYVGTWCGCVEDWDAVFSSGISQISIHGNMVNYRRFMDRYTNKSMRYVLLLLRGLNPQTQRSYNPNIETELIIRFAIIHTFDFDEWKCPIGKTNSRDATLPACRMSPRDIPDYYVGRARNFETSDRCVVFSCRIRSKFVRQSLIRTRTEY